jgi:hypothetical protein
MTDNDLKQLERSTFLAAVDSGLWDMFLACVLTMFVLGPYLSVPLGDFWASAVFLPFLMAALWGIRVVQTRVIQPRMGLVRFAATRQKRLRRMGVVMLGVNVVALVLGFLAASRGSAVRADLVPFYFSLTLLLGFSLVAFFLQLPRVFLYGLLLAAAPPIGEALFQRGYASHHGFPVVFGVCAAVIMTSGIIRFIRFLPPPSGQTGDSFPEENHG